MTMNHSTIDWQQLGQDTENQEAWNHYLTVLSAPSREVATNYPDFVRERGLTFRIRFLVDSAPTLAVLVTDTLRLVCRFETDSYLYVTLVEPTEAEHHFLSDRLNTAHGIDYLDNLAWYPGGKAYRFKLNPGRDYDLLKELTMLIYTEAFHSDAQNPAISPLDEPVDLNEEPEDVTSGPDQAMLDSIDQWLTTFSNKSVTVRQFASDYPRWLKEEFGDKVEALLWPPSDAGGALMVKINGRYRQHCTFNKSKTYFYTLLYDPTLDEIEYLKQRLFWPGSLRDKTPYVNDRPDVVGWRFFVHTENDYAALKEVVRRMVAREYSGGKLYDEAALEELIKEFQNAYINFNSQKYHKVERDYKVLAQDKLKELLNQNVLSQLIETEQFEEAARRIRYVANRPNLLNQFDKGPLQRADSKALATSFYTLLYGTQTFENRFEQWVTFLRSVPFNKIKPGLWPTATYFLMLSDPSRYIFVKPTPFDLFLEMVSLRFVGKRPTRPTAAYYNQLLELSRQLTARLEKLGARDLIDVQSFIWIVTSENEIDGDGDEVNPGKEEMRLPQAWAKASDFRDFVITLNREQNYSAQELYQLAQAFWRNLNPTSSPQKLVLELKQFRLIKETTPSVYTCREYTQGNSTSLLRLMVLGLLLPISGSYRLPALEAVKATALDSAALVQTIPGLTQSEAELLVSWYNEASVLQTSTGTQLELVSGRILGGDPANQESQRLIRVLNARINGETSGGLEPVDKALPLVKDLDQKLEKLGKKLLIDKTVIERIYSSLLSGRHVVLSGPPGTGKTELAKLLPLLLWEEAAKDREDLGLTLDDPPVITTSEKREGYAVNLVTATEDWGIRDVVGGIGPRLAADSSSVQYAIQYGHLTRTILQNYAGTNKGKELPLNSAQPRRSEYEDENGQRYRGIWLVIDEFTRAPVDAAFGSLLTTLGGGDAFLAVPTGDGETSLRLPEDFRIIGTLNSYDRHFLNQISEALKRRFNFIDVLPPTPAYEAFEQGIAVNKALSRLHRNRINPLILFEHDEGLYSWDGELTLTLANDGAIERPVIDWERTNGKISSALRSFWNIFRTIRLFRQLGTAQAEAVYTSLLTTAYLTEDWPRSLDFALSDTLSDQLQVLAQEELKILELYLLSSADSPDVFHQHFQTLLGQMSDGRTATLLSTLQEADEARNGTSDIKTHPEKKADLTAVQLSRVFALQQPLELPTPLTGKSVFFRRLRNLLLERGL